MRRTAHININLISPSPYQHRKYFNEEKLKELAASIQREGLIQPIVVRPSSNDRFELIAGERRLRAVRDHTDMDKIACSIVHVNDLKARRMSAAENLQREDLSTIETIEAIVEIADAELIDDKAYGALGKTPLERVKTVLRKIDSAKRSSERGFSPEKQTQETSNKFVRRVDKIFNNLPNPLDWQSFLKHDLPLLMNFYETSPPPRGAGSPLRSDKRRGIRCHAGPDPASSLDFWIPAAVYPALDAGPE